MRFTRVISLDFDGVLHAAGGPPGQMLPFEWLPILAHHVAPHSDVAVFVHSSWSERFSVDELQDFLEPLRDRVIGVAGAAGRQARLLEFLDAHPKLLYALVNDDDTTEFLERSQRVSLLVCDPLLGLSSSTTQRQLSAWLEGTANIPRPRA